MKPESGWVQGGAAVSLGPCDKASSVLGNGTYWVKGRPQAFSLGWKADSTGLLRARGEQEGAHARSNGRC